MKTVTINLYSFAELSEEAQQKAISNHINFEIEIMNEDSNFYYLAEKMDKMQAPWFLAEAIYENHKSEIIESIEINEYLFFENGEIAPCTNYVNANNEVELTQLNLNGTIYTL